MHIVNKDDDFANLFSRDRYKSDLPQFSNPIMIKNWLMISDHDSIPLAARSEAGETEVAWMARSSGMRCRRILK